MRIINKLEENIRLKEARKIMIEGTIKIRREVRNKLKMINL
jgi:hypothetical protein